MKSFPKVLTDLHAKLFNAGEILGIPKNQVIVRNLLHSSLLATLICISVERLWCCWLHNPILDP